MSSKKRKSSKDYSLLPMSLSQNDIKMTSTENIMNDMVVINVGGVRHETIRSTLHHLPNTTLTNDEVMARHYLPDKNEYFFDRNPTVFEYILNFYRIGELHLPSNICSNIVRHELDYWGIDHEIMQGCCWLTYNAQCGTYKTMQRFAHENRMDEMHVDPSPTDDTCWGKFRPMMWAILEDPYTSWMAKVFTGISITFLMTSIFVFCAETHPIFMADKNTTSTDEIIPVTSNSSSILVWMGYQNPYLGAIDIACYIYFTLEIILRFIFCPDKLRFFKSGFNLLDLFLVILFYIDMVINLYAYRNNWTYQITILQGLFVLRILRVFRVFRLVRHHRGLQVLVYTIKASMKEISLLVMFMTIGALLFGALAYYADRPNGNITSIPHGLWWAIVTMTTVGYGDMVPFTVYGKIVGGLCAICGLLMIAFSAPVIVNNFMLFYNQIEYGKKPDDETKPIERRLSTPTAINTSWATRLNCSHSESLKVLSADDCARGSIEKLPQSPSQETNAPFNQPNVPPGEGPEAYYTKINGCAHTLEQGQNGGNRGFEGDRIKFIDDNEEGGSSQDLNNRASTSYEGRATSSASAENPHRSVSLTQLDPSKEPTVAYVEGITKMYQTYI